MEYLDIVDENGNPTGEKVERKYAHKNVFDIEQHMFGS